jgi:hypothetical protein
MILGGNTLKEREGTADAISRFGRAMKAKLSSKGANDAPEDQLRAPLETLINHLSRIRRIT